MSARVTLFFCISICWSGFAGAQTQPIRLSVDLTDAPRKFLRAELSFPVKPGPLALVYPQWLPGEHAPTGPIDNLAGITFWAGGQQIPWHRDSVNMFLFRLDVPTGVAELKCKVDFLATAPATGFSAGASTSDSLAILSWNELLLYPAGAQAVDVRFEPSVKLPADWKYGTALVTLSTFQQVIRFQTVPLNTLVDSPVLTGRYFKEVPLAPEVTPKHYLDMAGDGPEDIEPSSEQIESLSNLIREASALYRSHHYQTYHFLLTLSDNVAHFGLEHHESSDDRVSARTLLDEDLGMLEGSLLPHEFTHSWNGKYRRPAGLSVSNFQQPMKGDLLWVYEGLTQYLGDVLAVRSGIWTQEQYKSYLAEAVASLDRRPGRTWRDLEDTAISAQILYDANEEWDNWRRSVDYYTEGELIWLEADTTIRKLSSGKRSLNDFCARFFGIGGDTGPELLPYTFDDLIANLNAIQPYDWRSFFNDRLTSRNPHAPVGGIEAGGYRLEYNAETNDFIRAEDWRDKGVNAWYSIGLLVADSVIDDVLIDSPAYRAGLGPGMRIVAVNGRQMSEDVLRDAVRASKPGQTIELIVENTGFYKVVRLPYTDGARYPHLVREPRLPALLDEVLKPLTKHAEPKKVA